MILDVMENSIARTEKQMNDGITLFEALDKQDKLLPVSHYILVGYSERINFPEKGKPGLIYVDTSTNKIYYWNDVSYVET